jgi:hypothetical protein
MSGEILYQYVGSLAKPLIETNINEFVLDASDFLHVFRAKERKSQNAVAKRIDKGRNNEEILNDLYVTSVELLKRIDASKIINKTLYKERVAEIVRLTHGMLYG